MPLFASCVFSRLKTSLSRIFRELHVHLSRNPCWAITPLMKIHSSPAKSHQIITDNSFTDLYTCSWHHRSPCLDRLLLIMLQGLLDHSLQNACWLSPAPSQNFCETFANKKNYPQTLAISRGRIRRKASTRGLCVWLWQSLAFGSLAAAFGLCFSRLQKRIPMSTRNQNYRNYSLFIEQCQTCWYPWKELQGTVHLYNVLIVIHHIQLSRNFRETFANKQSLSQTQTKLSRCLMLEPLRLSQLKTLTWTFRSLHTMWCSQDSVQLV